MNNNVDLKLALSISANSESKNYNVEDYDTVGLLIDVDTAGISLDAVLEYQIESALYGEGDSIPTLTATGQMYMLFDVRAYSNIRFDFRPSGSWVFDYQLVFK